MQGLRDGLDKRVFGYETGGGRKSSYWESPLMFAMPGGQGGKELDEAWARWRAKRRMFSEDELAPQVWRKASDHGYEFLVTLLPGGRLIEVQEKPHRAHFEGDWEFDRGILNMRTGEYVLTVFAAKDGNHSGVEFRDGEAAPNAYFRFTRVG